MMSISINAISKRTMLRSPLHALLGSAVGNSKKTIALKLLIWYIHT
jgi:hypothetical protein